MLKARGLGPVALATSIAFVFGQDAQMAANGNGVTDRELEVKDQLRQLQDRLRIFEERSAAINAALTAQFEERYAATNAALEAALDRITALEAVREEPTVSKAAYERPRRRLSSLDHNQVSGIQFKPAGGFNAEVGDDGKPQIYGDSSGELYFSSKLTGVVNLKEDIMEKIDAAEATIAAQADLIQQLNTTAASTYLTQASADSTYLTRASADSTYLTLASVDDTPTDGSINVVSSNGVWDRLAAIPVVNSWDIKFHARAACWSLTHHDYSGGWDSYLDAGWTNEGAGGCSRMCYNHPHRYWYFAYYPHQCKCYNTDFFSSEPTRRDANHHRYMIGAACALPFLDYFIP